MNKGLDWLEKATEEDMHAKSGCKPKCKYSYYDLSKKAELYRKASRYVAHCYKTGSSLMPRGKDKRKAKRVGVFNSKDRVDQCVRKIIRKF